MKRMFVILFTLALIVILPINAYAATGINEHEQAVLDLLESNVAMGANDWGFEIPQKYINTAKNFFAGDCDMTAEEKNAIISYINKGIEIVKAEANAQQHAGKQFDLSTMSAAARNQVLDLGKSACAEVDLQMSYNPKENAIVITKAGSSTPVFESSPIIKTTGQAITVDAAFVCTAVLLCLVLSVGVMFVISKKNGLFVK